MKKLGKFFAVMVMLFGCIALYRVSVKAAAVSGSDSYTHYFLYSDGGFCTITVEATYNEYYTSNGSYNSYNQRAKTILWSRVYSKEEPYIIFGNVVHSNGTTFQTWQVQSILYSPTWDFGRSYVNYQTATYSMTTNVTGTFYYTLNCDTGSIPIVAKSITIQL